MHAVQCTNGVCVKIDVGTYEISIAFENSLYGATPVVGRKYNRSDIRVYRNNVNITSDLFPTFGGELTSETDLLAVMTRVAQLAGVESAA